MLFFASVGSTLSTLRYASQLAVVVSREREGVVVQACMVFICMPPLYSNEK